MILTVLLYMVTWCNMDPINIPQMLALIYQHHGYTWIRHGYQNHEQKPIILLKNKGDFRRWTSTTWTTTKFCLGQLNVFFSWHEATKPEIKMTSSVVAICVFWFPKKIRCLHVQIHADTGLSQKK
jgi:hypothetical protein